MSSEPQFLSFKGLKQYTPEDGWGQVNSILQSHAQHAGVQQPAQQPAASQPHHYQPQHQAVPDNVPTLTETPDASTEGAAVFDPLINELFEQLRVPPSDDLTQTWRTIAAGLGSNQTVSQANKH
jgi:hypothetical protein